MSQSTAWYRSEILNASIVITMRCLSHKLTPESTPVSEKSTQCLIVQNTEKLEQVRMDGLLGRVINAARDWESMELVPVVRSWTNALRIRSMGGALVVLLVMNLKDLFAHKGLLKPRWKFLILIRDVWHKLKLENVPNARLGMSSSIKFVSQSKTMLRKSTRLWVSVYLAN